MSLWPQDDGTDPPRRYQGEKEVMENTAAMDMTHGIQNAAAMDMIHGIQNAATMDMPQGMQNAAIGETAKEMLGDGPAGQTGAVQPHGLGGDVFNWDNTSFETAGTSGGGGIVTDEMLDWLTTDEFENLTNWYVLFSILACQHISISLSFSKFHCLFLRPYTNRIFYIGKAFFLISTS